MQRVERVLVVRVHERARARLRVREEELVRVARARARAARRRLALVRRLVRIPAERRGRRRWWRTAG